MIDMLQIFLNESFWVASLRVATPLIFGVLGAPLWLGVIAAATAGGLFGLLHAIPAVPLGLSQHVSGLGITLFATSSASFLYRTILPNVSPPPRFVPFQPVDVPFPSDIPFFGPVVFQQTAMTWLALIMVGVVWWVINRTPLGIAIQAVGENPGAVNAQGLSVQKLRIGAVVAGSALMALGGAFLTMSAFDAFFFGMVNGRGWICIALVIFASWRPGKALIGALLFGMFDAFKVRMQTQAGAVVPSQIFLMAPYVFSIVALVIVARKAEYPRALLHPWFEGPR